VLHSRRVEGRSPAAVVVLRQLEVVTLAVHAAANLVNPAPRVQPRSDRGERVDIRAETRRFQRDEEQAAEAVSHGWRARALAVLVQSLSMPREFTALTATK
jgi:hypothetical protein